MCGIGTQARPGSALDRGGGEFGGRSAGLHAVEEARRGLRRSDFANGGVREDIEQAALALLPYAEHAAGRLQAALGAALDAEVERDRAFDRLDDVAKGDRSEEHTSELQS